MARTFLEKVTARFAVGLPDGAGVRVGDVVRVRPFHVMTHDNTGAVIPKFRAIGAGAVRHPEQPVFALDHDIQNESPGNLEKYARIEAFARENGVAFFPARTGIGHQIMAEEGFVHPGTLVVGSDSHSNIYGAMAAVGTPVVRTDAAAIWATGETWWEVPPVARVRLLGALPEAVSGKDAVLALIGAFRNDEVLNHVLEFCGEGVAALTMDERMTIANMTTEWGALAGIFPFDDTLEAYLRERARVFAERGDASPRLTGAMVDRMRETVPAADEDAPVAKEITIDLGCVVPQVAGPNEVKAVRPLPEIAAEEIVVHRAYLLSCVNSRLSDIEEAAAVAGGKSFADGVKFYLAAASAEVEARARKSGAWDALLSAGAIALPPGCGPCIGLGEGTLAAGETGISATNRNFQGRMGSRESKCYLASPAVVAASALAGKITGPVEFESRALVTDMVEHPAESVPRPATEILPGFPESLSGEIVLLPRDNLNTDGIYGKDVTYRDDLTPAQMAGHAFRNYDPAFQETARPGDLLVAGRNFGTGSSREQAATAIQHFGIPLVIAASYSQTYKRNAFNNGFPLVECPALVEWLLEEVGTGDAPTIRTGIHAEVDFRASVIRVDGAEYAFPSLGSVPQELVVAGGTEALVRERMLAGEETESA
ncbi:MAG: homoaconitase [Gemmatimonadota bacterium]|nr:homoaconitase [Gemmatimonadota bacterium]